MSGFFVEIGSADFDTLRPLCENGWSGIVVEPVPHFHDPLRAMFASYKDRVKIIPAAVSWRNGTTKMAVSTGDDWARGISHIVDPVHSGTSLSKHEQTKKFYTQEIEVTCLTLDTLLKGINMIELMKIDVEGHELNILESYSFRVKPKFMKVEHKHVNAKLLTELLRDNGYMVWHELDDLYAVC